MVNLFRDFYLISQPVKLRLVSISLAAFTINYSQLKPELVMGKIIVHTVITYDYVTSE